MRLDTYAIRALSHASNEYFDAITELGFDFSKFTMSMLKNLYVQVWPSYWYYLTIFSIAIDINWTISKGVSFLNCQDPEEEYDFVF